MTNKDILIGLVGRLDPIKDHPTFIGAVAVASKKNPHIRFICIGGGKETYRAELLKQVENAGLSEKIIWVGQTEDMVMAYNSLNILCLSSYGEGFPNVIGEAMACGIPVVTTDVGDASRVVGDAGIVVPVGDHNRLAAGILKIADMSPSERRNLGTRGRARIVNNFSLELMVSQTEHAIRKLIK